MYKIYKKVSDENVNESWLYIHEIDSLQELLDDLEYLRQDGFEYRAELKIESTSQILGV
jgi:hypothetical protein